MVRLCPICSKPQQNIYTHLSRTHKLDNSQRRYWLSQEKIQKEGKGLIANAQKQPMEPNCDPFQLLHPFTALVAGMTGSGKTIWVQNLLENAVQVIKPVPQRIIWSYSQWQPAYDQMSKTIPGIEFVKGIPHDIDEDWYFDATINNLIVIDDQMAETSNDKRILNLFTKGSHHRNLSVIFIVQNVYFQGKIMRTLSLNAAYLVLFKNPRDKLQMITLGKQMYPGKTGLFIQKYEAAIRRPFGYLFVDLKPNTAEECRLRVNVLPGESSLQLQRTSTESNKPFDQKLITNYIERQNLMQPPILNSMHSLNEKMQATLNEPNVSPDSKVTRYSQLLQRYLNLEKQFKNSNLRSPLNQGYSDLEQQLDNPNLSHSPSIPEDNQQIPEPTLNTADSPPTTPQNMQVTSEGIDSGFGSSYVETMPSQSNKLSVLQSFEKPDSEDVFGTPLKAPTTVNKVRKIPLKRPLPTPRWSTKKRIKWFQYENMPKQVTAVKPLRRSERLRAVIKRPEKWYNY